MGPQICFYVFPFILLIITHYSEGIFMPSATQTKVVRLASSCPLVKEKKCTQITVTTMMTFKCHWDLSISLTAFCPLL